jgi:hypothetical protein
MKSQFIEKSFDKYQGAMVVSLWIRLMHQIQTQTSLELPQFQVQTVYSNLFNAKHSSPWTFRSFQRFCKYEDTIVPARQ